MTRVLAIAVVLLSGLTALADSSQCVKTGCSIPCPKMIVGESDHSRRRRKVGRSSWCAFP